MINKPNLFSENKEIQDWDEWLSATEAKLKESGYGRYVQNHKNEDFAYWKTMKNGEEVTHQIGILFYDSRKYKDVDPFSDKIGIQFETMFCRIDHRIDMCVSKDITLAEYEEMSEHFYNSMLKFAK